MLNNTVTVINYDDDNNNNEDLHYVFGILDGVMLSYGSCKV